jgi:hypothetical protein
MTNYTVTVTRDDTGEMLAQFSDDVLEGEADTLEIVVEDPLLRASVSQTG